MDGASGPPIEALVVALRAEGLGVGVTDTLRVAAVLEAAAREAGGAGARPIDLEELRDLLRCVVASTMEERATFDRVFAAWSDGAQGAIGRRAQGLGAESGQRERPKAGPVERRRPARQLGWGVAAGALIGVVAVGALIALTGHCGPSGEVTNPDAGSDAGDAGSIEQEAAAPVAQRPTTFRARSVVFTVDRHPTSAILTQLPLALASAVALFFLGRSVRNATWLPRVLAPPSVPGPPEVPPLPIAEGARGAGLLTAGERDDLAFAVDRFIREEPSPELDASRSIDATIAAGGRAAIVFRPAIEHRTVWLWTDAASSSPLVPRFAGEVAAALAATGLPSERGRFACVPDRVDADERGALEPRELEDAAIGSAVLLVTDGEGLARRLGDTASRGWVRPLLRVLSRWPRVAFVAVTDEGQRALSAAFTRFDIGVSVLAPDEVQAFLAGQDPRPAPRERRRLVGDTLAWAAGCCLSGRPVDAPTALAVRAAMGIDATVWDIEAVLADVAKASGAGVAAAKRRADRLRWLAQVSGAGQGGVAVPEGSLLGRALAFFGKRLADEDAERTRRDGEDPWVDTPAQRELLRRRARLDLWAAPDEALAALHGLYPTGDPARRTALSGYAAGASRVELRAMGDGDIAMPWAIRGLRGASPVLAQDLGLRVIGEGEERWRKGVPGRAILAVGVVLGLSAGAAVGAVARWAQRPIGAPACEEPEGGWCDVIAGADGEYVVWAGLGRAWGSREGVSAGALVKAALGDEMRLPCEERVSAARSIRRCGKKEIPVPRGPGWVMRRSVGIVVGDEGDPERDAWADALLDSGSAEQGFLSSEDDPEAVYLQERLAILKGFQALVVDLKRESRGIPIVIHGSQGAVAELLAPRGMEREALTGTEVQGVAETWGNATVVFGHPQLAGVAVARAEVDAGAPARAEPVGPIYKSSECSYREQEDSGLVFVRVCGGTFRMGSSADDVEADKNEKPAHPVTVSTFWIGKYEVSNAEYRKAIGAHAPGEAGDLPAIGVTWDEAQKLCASGGHRLPTEAEWEYAARGPEGRKYPWGNEALTEKLAAFDTSRIAAVKSHADVGSPFGTVNQTGNAWEWVEDFSNEGSYAKCAGAGTVDPRSIACAADVGRVVRGGSFLFVPRNLRSALRSEYGQYDRNRFIGFRCVRGPRRQP